MKFTQMILLFHRVLMACAKDIRHKEVLRHEIIHAFFDEAGLNDYSNNEQLVEWIAFQFPKMFRTFVEADCL